MLAQADVLMYMKNQGGDRAIFSNTDHAFSYSLNVYSLSYLIPMKVRNEKRLLNMAFNIRNILKFSPGARET